MENNSTLPVWAKELLDILDPGAALKMALSKGGELSDLYWEEVASTSLTLEDGRLEKMLAGFDSGVGLRTVFNGHQALTVTNFLDSQKMMDMALTLSKAVSDGSEINLQEFSKAKIGPAFKVKLRPEEVNTDKKVALMRQAEKVARGVDSRIKQVKIVYADKAQKVLIINSNGTLAVDERIGCLFMVQVVAVDGSNMQVGYEPAAGAIGFELFEEHPPEAIAVAAARRAILMLEAEESPSGTMPVVLSSEAGGTMIHEAVGHGLEADLAGEGLSVYGDRIGDQVASPIITVIDDATIPYKRGSFAYDDEGAKAENTVLVENGILKGYMHDYRSAQKAGVSSTGNGRRESYRHPPVVRMTNTIIVPGKSDPDEILSRTDKGLFVRKMGGGQVDTVNGEFMFEVSEGYLIENGQIGPPVRGATMTGSGPDILNQIDMVGTDLGYSAGTCGKDGQGVPVDSAQPTLRMPQIVVGGRKG